MASASASAGVVPPAAESTTTSDLLRLRPRLLHALLSDRLPLPDEGAGLPQQRRPADDLAYAAEAVRAHGLLAEHAAEGADHTELREEWRAAVDAWVHRLLGLINSDRDHSRWVGTSFLGLTIQECSDARFLKHYPDWFQKVLGNIKAPSCITMVNMSTCISMYDLFLRLSTFSELKNEATSLASKVMTPLLRLLDKNSPVTEKAADLLGLLMKLFPSSVSRHFNKVESVITAKIMSGQYNLQQSKKLASTLALLPCVRVSEDSISVMIRKILTVVNSMLNNTFPGLEVGHIDQNLLMLLAPPRTKLVPPLGGQTIYGDQHIQLTTESHAHVLRTISALIHCCSVMLTSSYPIQVVNIPTRALITLIQKVLLIDGSLHKPRFQSSTSLYQEHICFDIPTLHSIFLDLLASTIKGMRSSLIPHAGIIVTLIAEYFKRAKLPSIRRKLYTIVRLLLSSMGVGMAMQLLQVVISNIFADLDDNSGSSLFSACTDPAEATTRSSLIVSSNMEQTQQLQSSTVPSSESSSNGRMMAPLCVKIGALETLEVLLHNVRGSFGACTWRTEMDRLLIDVATKAYFEAGMYEREPSRMTDEDPSVPDFRLASFKALLASFLSTPHERPCYLEQGLELFNRGKLETGTELGNFCSHALLTLDVLIHPRQPPPRRGAHSHGDLGSGSGGTERPVPASGAGTSQPAPCSVGKRRRAADDLQGGERIRFRPLVSSVPEEEPTGASARSGGGGGIAVAVEKHAPVESSGVQRDVQSCYPAPIGCIISAPDDPRNHGDDETSNKTSTGCRQGGVLSGDDGSGSSQNVAAPHACCPDPDLSSAAAASLCGSEWDSVDPLLDIIDPNVDSQNYGW